MSEDIAVEKRGHVQWVTMNRPDARNALRADTINGFVEAFKEAKADNDVRVIVVTGNGPAFSAGGDVKEMAGVLQNPDRDVFSARAMVQQFHTMINALYEIEKPVICAVNGKAFGAGCNVALACDLRVAADDASFCWAFVQRGLVTDAGSTFLLQRLVGYSKALELLTLGDTVDAAESLRLGIVNKVVPKAQLLEQTEALAQRMAQGPPQAISMIKRALQCAALTSLREALENEANLQAIAFGGKEFIEGVMSFMEKRAPKF